MSDRSLVPSEPAPRVIIAATAVAMCRGGLVECVELARHLKLALCAFADRAPPSDLSEAAEAACDLVDAVRDGNVPVFDHRRDRLGRALPVNAAGLLVELGSVGRALGILPPAAESAIF